MKQTFYCGPIIYYSYNMTTVQTYRKINNN